MIIESAPKKGLTQFTSHGLHENVANMLKQKLGLVKLTSVQMSVIPLALKGYDIVASSYTGSGKTLAYLLPMLQFLSERDPSKLARAVVILPTRELTLQIASVMESIGIDSINKGNSQRLAHCVLVGTDAMNDQFVNLAKNPDVVLGTPGRLLHHIHEYEANKLNFCQDIRYIVLDEADQLLGANLGEAVLKICNYFKKITERQMLLLSATITSGVLAVCDKYLRHYKSIVNESMIPNTIDLDFVLSKSCDKLATLIHVYQYLKPKYMDTKYKAIRKAGGKNPRYKSILFVASKHHVEFMCHVFKSLRLGSTVALYGNMSVELRDTQLNYFRSARNGVLITTDVGSRGLDIPSVDLVVNYDFPTTQAKALVHRIGRTGRMGAFGRCISILTEEDLKYLSSFSQDLGRRLVLPNDIELPMNHKLYDSIEPWKPVENAAALDMDEETKRSKFAYVGCAPSTAMSEINGDMDKLANSEYLDLQKRAQDSMKAQLKDKVAKESIKLSKYWISKCGLHDIPSRLYTNAGMVFDNNEFVKHLKMPIRKRGYGDLDTPLTQTAGAGMDKMMAIRNISLTPITEVIKTGSVTALVDLLNDLPDDTNKRRKFSLRRSKIDGGKKESVSVDVKCKTDTKVGVPKNITVVNEDNKGDGESNERLLPSKKEKNTDDVVETKDKSDNAVHKLTPSSINMGLERVLEANNSIFHGAVIPKGMSLKCKERPDRNLDINDAIKLQKEVADYHEDTDDKKRKGVMRWDPRLKKYQVTQYTAEGKRIKQKDQYGNIKNLESKATGKMAHWIKEQNRAQHLGKDIKAIDGERKRSKAKAKEEDSKKKGGKGKGAVTEKRQPRVMKAVHNRKTGRIGKKKLMWGKKSTRQATSKRVKKGSRGGG